MHSRKDVSLTQCQVHVCLFYNIANNRPVGKQYWANVGAILCTILDNIGHSIGPMLAINIGPILVKHVVQYWPNIGHDIAPILAALHNDNIGQYC